MASTTLTLELPKELQGDPAWRAALHILEHGFPNDARVWKYVDAKRWSIYFDRMIAGGAWSGGERILLQATAALFDAEHTVSLWEAGHRMSEAHWTIFLEALSLFRDAAGT